MPTGSTLANVLTSYASACKLVVKRQQQTESDLSRPPREARTSFAVRLFRQQQCSRPNRLFRVMWCMQYQGGKKMKPRSVFAPWRLAVVLRVAAVLLTMWAAWRPVLAMPGSFALNGA